MDSKERIAKALSISTDTKVFEMGQGVYKKASKVFVESFPGRKAIIVAEARLTSKVKNTFISFVFSS